MPIVDALLPEYDREMATTRKLLERLPEDRLEWKPHAKSWSLVDLAQHIAIVPMWGHITLTQPEIDIGSGLQTPKLRSRPEILTGFDKFVAETRKSLAGTTDAQFMVTWTLKHNGKAVFSMPRTAVWRTFVLSHLIHHRGQLSVYLRLLNVPVPSIYGPSADEGSL